MKQKERKKGSSTLENYELPLNNPYSISSDIQTTSAAFNVFEDEDEDEDEDLDLNGNIGSKMLTTIHKKKTSLLRRNVTAEIKVSLIISCLYYNFYFYNL
jgi:hypothetical protein